MTDRSHWRNGPAPKGPTPPLPPPPPPSSLDHSTADYNKLMKDWSDYWAQEEDSLPEEEGLVLDWGTVFAIEGPEGNVLGMLSRGFWFLREISRGTEPYPVDKDRDIALREARRAAGFKVS